MKPGLALLSIATAMLVAGCADPSADHPTSSYPELQESEVRGLTPEEIAGLRAGDGMGYALPAELNGYPGPKHVLELADQLGLNESQRLLTEELRASMLQEARATGASLIEAYQALDTEFRATSINATRLRELTRGIGVLEGELRAIHMEAHLEMMSILTHPQIREYSELRGYDAQHAHGH